MPEAATGYPLVFGEVLFDTFPDGNRVLGGAPFNVAWHLQAFGAGPLLVSRIGSDEAGRGIARRMQDWGMSTAALQLDASHPTGSVAVRYDDEGQPSFDILADQAYDFIDAAALPAPKPAPALLYHGSLAVRRAESAAALQRLKENGAPVFVDVNLRDPWWEPETLQELLADARWIKLNEDELRRLTGQERDSRAAAAALFGRPELETVFVTLGAEGALAVTRNASVQVRPAGDVAVVDPVGAGDGFASVLLLGLLRGWPIEQTMERAQAFASHIVQRQGATVAERAFYAPFLEDWGIA